VSLFDFAPAERASVPRQDPSNPPLAATAPHAAAHSTAAAANSRDALSGDSSDSRNAAAPRAGGNEGEEAEMRRAVRQHPVLTGLRRLGCPIVHPDFLKFLPRPEPEAMARNALAALGVCVCGREGGREAGCLWRVGGCGGGWVR
jgi:hypothetical protein